MREDQFIGINPAAHKRIKEVHAFPLPSGDTFESAWNGTESLNKYVVLADTDLVAVLDLEAQIVGLQNTRWALIVNNGIEIFREFVQASPWSSGPMWFLALKDENGTIQDTLWTDAQLNEEEPLYEITHPEDLRDDYASA